MLGGFAVECDGILLSDMSSNETLEIINRQEHFEGSPVIEKWIDIKNISSKDIRITRVDSFRGTLPAGNYILKYFLSDAGCEFTPQETPLAGTKILEVTSGRSSKGMHPWFFLQEEGGSCLACAIAWSGNWIVRFEPASDGRYAISGGLSNWNFSKLLKPGQTMEGVHVIYMVLPQGSTDEAAVEFARWGRKYWYPENDLTRRLPVEWNHWWPYEDVDINEEVFRANVDECEKLGIEVCTVDAGWFGEPDPDCNSNKAGWSVNVDWYLKRGDWHKVNTIRFPSGMRALSDYVRSKGMKFGIWCEIEALGAKADLAVLHPEFVAIRDGEPLGYVCMGNPETVNWAYNVLENLISGYGAQWLKLDFNLDPRAGCNRTDHGHGEGDGLYEHYMGYYRLLDRIRTAHPEVFIENCSSGGLRIDLGMAKRVHSAFLSDPDPTVHHLQVFWGASTLLAPSRCFHFAWSQNRVFYQSNIDKDPIKEEMPGYKLDFIVRADMLNHLGFSYRLPELPQWCYERIRQHIAFYKEVVERFVREADMYRLTGQALRTGEGDRWNSFLYVTGNQSEALLFVFRLPGAESDRAVKLKGIRPDANYELSFIDGGKRLEINGSRLMNEGLLFAGLAEESSEVVKLWMKKD